MTTIKNSIMDMPPGVLKPHPLLSRVGMLPDLIEREDKKGKAAGKNRAAHKEAAEQMLRELEGVAESIRQRGIKVPLKIIANPAGGYWIADGRHRWTIALAEGMDTVPCELIEEDDVVGTIMDGVQHRHLSKGGRAYLAVLMHPEVAKDSRERQKAGTPSAFSAEGIAKESGVSPRLIEDAIAIYRQFEKRGDIREIYEDGIWVGQGLAKIRAGIEGYLKTGIEPDEEPETDEQARKRITQERLETAMSNWTRITTSLKHWETIPAAGRREIIKVVADTIREAPDDFRSGLLDSIGAVTV